MEVFPTLKDQLKFNALRFNCMRQNTGVKNVPADKFMMLFNKFSFQMTSRQRTDLFAYLKAGADPGTFSMAQMNKIVDLAAYRAYETELSSQDLEEPTEFQMNRFIQRFRSKVNLHFNTASDF